MVIIFDDNSAISLIKHLRVSKEILIRADAIKTFTRLLYWPIKTSSRQANNKFISRQIRWECFVFIFSFIWWYVLFFYFSFIWWLKLFMFMFLSEGTSRSFTEIFGAQILPARLIFARQGTRHWRRLDFTQNTSDDCLIIIAIV